MTKEIDFQDGVTIVPADWLDAIQEVFGHIVNFRLEKASSTSVRVTAGTGKDQVGLPINGKMRYATVTKNLTISGAANTYNVFATADTADRDFALTFTAAASPAATNYRLIGQVVWDGSAITGEVINLAGPPPTHNAGFSGAPTVPTQSTADNSTQIVNSAWVTSKLTSYATLASPALTGVPTAPTAAPGTNTTQLATTAFVTANAGSGHQAVRAVADSNINTASPGSAIDGVTLSSGDLVLLTGQTTPAQNGAWTWNGAAVAMTRPTWFTAAAAPVLQLLAREGTKYAETVWVLVTDGAITVDTTGLSYASVAGQRHVRNGQTRFINQTSGNALLLDNTTAASNGLSIAINGSLKYTIQAEPAGGTPANGFKIYDNTNTKSILEIASDGTLNLQPTSGDVTSQTPLTSDNSTKVATTAFVKSQGYAILASGNTFTASQTISGIGAAASRYLRIDVDNGQQAAWQLFEAGLEKWTIGKGSASDNLFVYNGGLSSNALEIQSSDNVIIAGGNVVLNRSAAVTNNTAVNSRKLILRNAHDSDTGAGTTEATHDLNIYNGANLNAGSGGAKLVIDTSGGLTLLSIDGVNGQAQYGTPSTGVAQSHTFGTTNAANTLILQSSTGRSILLDTNGIAMTAANNPSNDSFIASPILSMIARYDSDTGAGVTASTYPFNIGGVMTAAGASPAGYMDFKPNNVSRMQLNSVGQLALSTTGNTGGLLVGGDVQWYRAAANEWRTPDNVRVDSLIYADGGIRVNSGSGIFDLTFGGLMVFDGFSDTALIIQSETGSETENSFQMQANGKMVWDDGTDPALDSALEFDSTLQGMKFTGFGGLYVNQGPLRMDCYDLRNVSSATTLDVNDHIVCAQTTTAGAGFTITLPVPEVGKVYTIVDSQGDADDKNVTIAIPSGDTLDGVLNGTVVLNIPRESVDVCYVATDTWITL